MNQYRDYELHCPRCGYEPDKYKPSPGTSGIRMFDSIKQEERLAKYISHLYEHWVNNQNVGPNAPS